MKIDKKTTKKLLDAANLVLAERVERQKKTEIRTGVRAGSDFYRWTDPT